MLINIFSLLYSLLQEMEECKKWEEIMEQNYQKLTKTMVAMVDKEVNMIYINNQLDNIDNNPRVHIVFTINLNL